MNNLSALLTDNQFSTVYNMLSLGLASMLFTSIFLFIGRDRVLPRYRMAVMVSATVTAIAAYHYFRIFDSFSHAFGGAEANPYMYNVGYRYVDWLLTVPLLLVETVAVLALARSAQSSMLKRLVPAAGAMILLGYPGDAKLDLFGLSGMVWGVLSCIPFVYILYVLFVELSKSLERQSEAVRSKVQTLRVLLVLSWMVYPITYFIAQNSSGFDAASFVNREVGYTIADVTAKCVFGLIIFTIARIKSAEDSEEFAKTEFRD
jgi:bacteriorhodopsin